MAAILGAGGQQTLGQALTLRPPAQRPDWIGIDWDAADGFPVVNLLQPVDRAYVVPAPDRGGVDGLPTLRDDTYQAVILQDIFSVLPDETQIACPLEAVADRQ